MANIIAPFMLLAGWFGYQPKPNLTEDGQEIGGYRGSGNDFLEKRRNKRRTISNRHRIGYGVGHRRRYMQRQGMFRLTYSHVRQLPDDLKCGRGTEWIKENRRRRAYGLRQLRQEVTDNVS